MTQTLVFEPHIDSLRRFAISLTRNSDQANDLVQETILKVLSKMDEDTQIENPKAYLMSMLHNLFIDSTRRTKRRGEAVSIDDYDAPSGEASQELKQETAKILTLMEALPDEMSDVLHRHVTQEQSYQEIADDLHVPVGTVMSRISRARDALKKKLCGGDKNCPELQGAIASGL